MKVLEERDLHSKVPADIARAFAKAWADGDVATAKAFLAEDAVYECNLSGDVLPVSGKTVGRNEIEILMRRLQKEFEYLLYRPLNVVSDGDDVRLQVEFMYRHRASGETLTGRSRLVVHIAGGLILRADAYYDRAMVETFFRLFGSPQKDEAP
jgi:ketosteroid isomerase-like protein